MKKTLGVFLSLAVTEGILTLFFLLVIPSDPKTDWLLGYSRSRVQMMAAALVGNAIFTYLLLVIRRNPSRLSALENQIKKGHYKKYYSGIILGLFSFGLVLGSTFLIFAITNLDYRVPSDAVTSMEQIKAYLFRLAPFIMWFVLLCLQGIVLLTLSGYSTETDQRRVFEVLAILVWPLWLVIFYTANRIDPFYYVTITKEDQLVEWLTFVFLCITAVLAIVQAIKTRRDANSKHIFFILFALTCILFALEEISWSQRIFGMESPEYFIEHSDQQEINIHNVINKQLNVRTKYLAAIALLSYGVVLPLISLIREMRSQVEKLHIVIPPLVLIPGFVIASLMTWDRYFNGQDEEVSELFFSISLFLVILYQFLDLSSSSPQENETSIITELID